MGEQLKLSAAVMRQPNEDTPAAMLFDFLMEQGGSSEEEVRDHVEHLREQGRFIIDMEHVERMNRERPHVWAVLVADLITQLDQLLLLGVRFDVEQNAAAPTVTFEMVHEGNHWHRLSTVHVGASWLMAFYRRNRARFRLLAERWQREQQ